MATSYVNTGYWNAGYATEEAEYALYVNTGYWNAGYAVGETTPAPTSRNFGTGGGVWIVKNTRDDQEAEELTMLINAFLEVQ